MNSFSSSLLLFIGFAAFSGLLSLYSLWRAATRHLRGSAALCASIKKLYLLPDLNRARKLCAAIPQTTVIGRLSLCLVDASFTLESNAGQAERLSSLQRALTDAQEKLQREESSLLLAKALSLLWFLVALFFATKLSDYLDDCLLALFSLLILWYAAERLERKTKLHQTIVVPDLLYTLSSKR